MDSKAKFFFLVAGFVIFLWGGIEVTVFYLSGESEKTCKIQNASLSSSVLRDSYLLSYFRNTLWTYNSRTGDLEKRHLSANQAQVPSDFVSKLSLICEKPAYNCLNAFAREVSPLVFNENFLLVNVMKEGMKKTFPISLSQRSIRLGGPLNFCGEALDGDSANIFFNGDNVIYHDLKRKKVGYWQNFSFQGSVLKAQAREPDKIYKITQGHLYPSDCLEEGSGEGVFFVDGKILTSTTKSIGPESNFLIYSLDSLRRLSADPVLESLYKQRKNRFELFRVFMMSSPSDSIVRVRSRRVLSEMSFEIHGKEVVTEFKDSDRSLYRKKIPYIQMAIQDKEGWILQQKKKDIVFSRFICQTRFH